MAGEQEGLTEQCITAGAAGDVQQTVFIDSLTVLIVSIDEKSRDNKQTHSGLCKIKIEKTKEIKTNKENKMAHVTSMDE